jgi:hypothetical protein
VRSERQLMEQIDYNLLFRWFVGLGIDDPVWDHSTFSKNRDRLLDADVAAKFLEAALRHPQVKRFLSDDHFSVDGTLVEAWASLKSFRAKEGGDEPPAPGRNGERPVRSRRRGASRLKCCASQRPKRSSRLSKCIILSRCCRSFASGMGLTYYPTSMHE